MSNDNGVQSMAKENQGRPATHREDEILDVAQVAAMFGRSPPTIRRWIADGLLATVRMPSGLKKVRRSVVEKFLEGTTVASGKPVTEEYRN